MPTPNKKLSATISVWSNSYGAPTGYGQQAEHLINKLKQAGADVAMLSNYGLEGRPSKIDTPYGKVPHFPRGLDAYSNDSGPLDHKNWIASNKEQPNLMITLYDVWVLTAKAFNDFPIAAWVPLDHISMPPGVEAFLTKENVTPIAMSPHGVRQMQSRKIDCEYVPHAIDTKVYKPTDKIQGRDINEYMGIEDDTFLVGMVAANKANGMVHRKAYSENILAFSIFAKDNPKAKLYIHTDPIGMAGGWNLLPLLKACGLEQDQVLLPNPDDYRFGYEQENLAAIYSRMDVLLATSYGEGFGVPTVEALGCGTRVIGSGWAATPDLLSEDSWMVEGQPSWNASQNAWWQVPSVPSIVSALKLASKETERTSQQAVAFAKQFDIETVWQNHWMPTLTKLLK
jgi:glycosyltransferase involved in cell wall biosynthesis